MKPLSQAAIKAKLKDLPGWSYQDQALASQFKFQDFFMAFSFMIKVATQAEKMQHHPDWRNVYNTVEIKLYSHGAGGVTDKDFELAAIINDLAG